MKEIKTKLVGMQHVLGKDYSLVLATLTSGTRLKLVHEESNPVDPNAVAAYIKNMKLGYLKKDIAKKLTKKLYRTHAEISKITGQNWGINIVLTFDEFKDIVEQDNEVKSI